MKDYIKYYLCLFGTIKEGGLNGNSLTEVLTAELKARVNNTFN